MKTLAGSPEGRDFLKKIDDYKMEYGNKSMWAHEYIYPTWRENPTPIVEAIRGYLTSDYDYEKDVRQLRENRDAAIAAMWALVPATVAEADRDRLRSALDLALKMTPLTPDHHFYMDQGTYARVRLVLMAVGRKLVEQSVLQEADDVMFLTYHELRVISADPAAFDVKSLVAERRTERQAAFGRRPRLWAGTITHWSLHEEPYKQGNWDWPGIYERSKEAAKSAGGTLRGLGASAGVVEGTARVVDSPEQFDQVQKGELLICKMTSPAWVVLFTKIAGLVTDSGGALSHPAVVSREFGIPAVVGTRTATQTIKTGQRLRVDGAAGTVEVLALNELERLDRVLRGRVRRDPTNRAARLESRALLQSLSACSARSARCSDPSASSSFCESVSDSRRSSVYWNPSAPFAITRGSIAPGVWTSRTIACSSRGVEWFLRAQLTMRLLDARLERGVNAGRRLRIDSADCCREVVISRVAGGIDRQAIRCRDGLEPAGWLEHRKVPRRRSAVRDIADDHGEVADEAVGGEPREHARMRRYRLHEQAHDRIRFAERRHVHRVRRTAERRSRRLSRRRRCRRN